MLRTAALVSPHWPTVSTAAARTCGSGSCSPATTACVDGRRRGADRAQGADGLAADSSILVARRLFERRPGTDGGLTHLAERLG